MTTPREGWTCGDALREGGLVISFQRYVRPAGGLSPDWPRSLGALPIASGPGGRHLLPIADDEAFWIGLSLAAPTKRIALALAATSPNSGAVDVVTGETWNEYEHGLVLVPDCSWVDGVRLPDGHKVPFVRGSPRVSEVGWTGLLIYLIASGECEKREDSRISDRALKIRFVTYTQYAALAGCAPPAPIDPTAGYEGWLLP